MTKFIMIDFSWECDPQSGWTKENLSDRAEKLMRALLPAGGYRLIGVCLSEITVDFEVPVDFRVEAINEYDLNLTACLLE